MGGRPQETMTLAQTASSKDGEIRQGGKYPGKLLQRGGDEIVVCGQMFHTGARVVTWLEHNGFNAYSCTNINTANNGSPPPPPALRYGTRKLRAKKGVCYPSSRLSMDRDSERSSSPFGPREWEEVRPAYWDLPNLQQALHQVVVHYDGCGTAKRCFKVLHDERGLSCHFIIDVDGTIYQTLDLRERAWHATVANDCSVGIELCQVGAFSTEDGSDVLDKWYTKEGGSGEVQLTIPPDVDSEGGSRDSSRHGSPDKSAGKASGAAFPKPARPEVVTGKIHGAKLQQYDFTSEQYEALGSLIAALCNIFPRIRPTFPKQKNGQVVQTKLGDEVLVNFEGIIGHYHVQSNKIDPGPAFQWEKVVALAEVGLLSDDLAQQGGLASE